MSIKNWPGGYITPTPITPTGPYQDGAAPGVWTLDQAAYWQKQGLWPMAGVPAPIALFGGGSPNTGGYASAIRQINPLTTGNTTAFGNLTVGRLSLGACSSSIRGVFGGGQISGGYSNVMDYVTIATAGNATDFGSLSPARAYPMGCSNSTRGLFAGGYNGGTIARIDYITIETTGSSVYFGDLFSVPIAQNPGACASTTRAVLGGANNNVIQYVTIATTGNSTDFGDFLTSLTDAAACSSATRGLWGGNATSPASVGNVIQYITIATTGNTTDFGDLTLSRFELSAAAGGPRATFAGGKDTGYSQVNVIDYVTIATLGNAADFGDLAQLIANLAGCSNSHGGL